MKSATTKSEPVLGPSAIAEGYSINGSQAKSVAVNSAGTLRSGNRFSVSGPVRVGFSAAPSRGTARNPQQTIDERHLMVCRMQPHIVAASQGCIECSHHAPRDEVLHSNAF